MNDVEDRARRLKGEAAAREAALKQDAAAQLERTLQEAKEREEKLAQEAAGQLEKAVKEATAREAKLVASLGCLAFRCRALTRAVPLAGAGSGG